MVPARILIVDDDERLADMLATYLRSRGFEVELRLDATSGLRALEMGRFDIAVLDVMLPDFDGLELLRRLRVKSNVPVLMLTARGEDMDRIVGLELGADDYLPKPFNPREVVARLSAILRRGRAVEAAPGDVLRFGRLEVDRAAHEARVDGKVCLLTAHQFELLRVLAERAGRVQTREQLMQAVRGEDLEEFDRSIDVHVSRIRAAIEDDPKHPRRIRTVRAVGYVFSPLSEDLADSYEA
ncbi:MAG: DNA-binding response regulator [Myxococcaceae bacterium]|nr:DNA-binding response regulator [Myxococcaceae bacterium]